LVSLLRKVIPNQVRIPAFVLIIASFVTIVRLLLDNGANIKARNGGGDTAKTLALKNKHLDIVDLIFEYEEKK
jgi:ankyrin repeat protein